MAAITTEPTALRQRVRASFSPREWRSMYGMFGFIVALHVAGFTLLIIASSQRYGVGSGKVLGIGTGILAYSLGMRHAFDADHIAAIDNTKRKFMSEGKRPMSVGFFF